ncbi:hypothetical protein [Pseudomonas fulva]
MSHEIGTLTPGKKADVVTISTKRALSPSADAIGTVVLHSSAANVDTVLVNGVIKKRNGELVGYDLDAIRARARSAFDRINENVAGMPSELTLAELEEFLTNSERSTRANFAAAYSERDRSKDWLRSS